MEKIDLKIDLKIDHAPLVKRVEECAIVHIVEAERTAAPIVGTVEFALYAREEVAGINDEATQI